MRLLEFLRGREKTLALVAAMDVKNRKLKEDAVAAAVALADVDGRARRSILAELLRRGLYLAKVANKQRYFAQGYTMEGLLKAAALHLADVKCSTSVMQRLGATQAELAHWEPSSWVQVAVLKEYADEQEALRAMPMHLDFHRHLATVMDGHLKLTGEGILRTPWLAAAVLSKDATLARDAARDLVQHIGTVAATGKTKFEAALHAQKQLMSELSSFSLQTEPRCLWKGGPQWANLYKFLAVRFLANPDNVMDVERLHATWKWVLMRRRSLKLKSLNAWLKLGSFLHHNGALPSMDVLTPYIQDIRAGYLGALQAVRSQDVIAPGQRWDSLWWTRLNLSTTECALLRGEEVPLDKPLPPRTFELAWANYIRKTIVTGTFHSFPWLRPRLYVFITENKSLPGREKRSEHEAQGRSLACAWFQTVDDTDPNEILVQPVDRSSASLATQLSTIAEILHTAGEPYPALGADATASQVETAMEACYARQDWLLWDSSQQWLDETPWRFILSNPQPAEETYLALTPLEQHTNMALASILEREKGLDRAKAWRSLTKAGLIAAITAP